MFLTTLLPADWGGVSELPSPHLPFPLEATSPAPTQKPRFATPSQILEEALGGRHPQSLGHRFVLSPSPFMPTC